MKKIYLQYPWRFPDSPYYKSLVENHPVAIKYLGAENQKGVITNKKKFLLSNKLKTIIRSTFNFFNFSVPNISRSSSKENFDLIHCAHCLSSEKDKPWVADFEGQWQMFIGKKTSFGIRRVRKIIERKNCKKIIPWTKHAAKEIIELYPSIKGKVELVYPAVPLMRSAKSFSSEKITLIFVGRYFYWKGGLHALEAMDTLTKKYENVKAIVVSDVPEDIRNKYSNNAKIKFFGLMPQEKVFEIYRESDISIYPGYSDSFGFGFLESMSFGIPSITVDNLTRKELIDDGRTGFVVVSRENISLERVGDAERKIINDLVDKASMLIEDKKKLEKMSKNCIEEIKKGKFSIANRNKKLSRIYSEALK